MTKLKDMNLEEAFNAIANLAEKAAHPLLSVERLTKREYFAACALAGILGGDTNADEYSDPANCAVNHADALIAALNETKTD